MIWCAEHKASVGPDDPLDGPEDHCLRWYYDWDHPNSPTLTECSMMEALLIVKENGLQKRLTVQVAVLLAAEAHVFIRHTTPEIAALAENIVGVLFDALASAGGDS